MTAAADTSLGVKLPILLSYNDLKSLHLSK